MKSSFQRSFNFTKYLETVVDTETIKYTGKIRAVRGLEIESNGPRCVIGEMCTIVLRDGSQILAEVVGLDGKIVKLSAFGDTKGIEVDCEVVASGKTLQVPVGNSLIGRVIDATGRPCDKLGELIPETYYPAIAQAPDPMKKKRIDKRIKTGVRAIDSLLTIGKGQRIGIFAGSGVGKSTLLGSIAKNSSGDVNVIGLIGERGREVLDFIENDLGKNGLAKSVVVVATGDKPAICRVRAAYVCTAIAEYFRDKGKDVVLMIDNVTRFAKAQQEIGTSTGELPIHGGYPPSVFDMLPKLMERTGTNDKGSITALYNVLVDGDDMNEPITDAVRGILDGHIVLSRKLAEAYHYPAIDVLASISRLSNRVNGPVTKKAIAKVRTLMATYQQNATMITTGIYQKGSSPAIDLAIEKHEIIEDFLKQDIGETSSIEDTLKQLSQIAEIEIPEEEFAEDAASVKISQEENKESETQS